MFEPREEQQQWELELELAEQIGGLFRTRAEAENAERQAGEYRAREARQRARIAVIRQKLGLPDTAVSRRSWLQAHEAEASDKAALRTDRRDTPQPPAEEG